MTIVQNGVLRYGHFSDFWSNFGDRIVNVNAGQNKFEVHIYQFGQNGHQLAQNRPDATLAQEH